MSFIRLAELTGSTTLERIADKISTISLIIFLITLTTLLSWDLLKLLL